MIHAYNESYLSHAEKTIGYLFERSLSAMSVSEFTDMFLNSSISRSLENGNPTYLVGKSGTELYLEMSGKRRVETRISENPSIAYWCGMVYCYAQWYFACSYEQLFSAISIDELSSLYPTLHEADISKAIGIIHNHLYPQSALQSMRQKRKLSQSQLARISNVNLRSIKAYEQGDLDISKAQYDTLSRLANALSCEIQDLIS